MDALFLVLRAFCVCPQLDVSEHNYYYNQQRSREGLTRIFPPLEPAARFPALGGSFTSPRARL